MNPNRSASLSAQIVTSLFVLTGVGLLSLMLVGHNAISAGDEAAAARQERFAERHLAAQIAGLPNDQRSATVWDEAVLRTGARDQDWMDNNLGIWMQDYFGHNESYVLDRENTPIYAAISVERASASIYEARAATLAPLVAQVRAAMAEASEGVENPYEELAEVSVVAPLRYDDVTAIVSVVRCLSR